jgi:hypothetical protein
MSSDPKDASDNLAEGWAPPGRHAHVAGAFSPSGTFENDVKSSPASASPSDVDSSDSGATLKEYGQAGSGTNSAATAKKAGDPDEPTEGWAPPGRHAHVAGAFSPSGTFEDPSRKNIDFEDPKVPKQTDASDNLAEGWAPPGRHAHVAGAFSPSGTFEDPKKK